MLFLYVVFSLDFSLFVYSSVCISPARDNPGYVVNKAAELIIAR